jgi:hypothetical protein
MKKKHNILNSKNGKNFFAAIMAIAAGLLFGLIILLCTNAPQAFPAFIIILMGGFTDGMAGLGQVLYLATPIILTGLSVGFAFKTKKYAEEFFNLLRGYNDGKDVDVDDNIKLSLITENSKDYLVYVYPSPERKNVINSFKEMEKKFGKDNQHLIVQLTLCKTFPYGDTSSFKRFKENYIKEVAEEYKDKIPKILYDAMYRYQINITD